MNTQLFYFDDCPCYQKALDNLNEALRSEGVAAQVQMMRVASEQNARAKRFIGSPAIRIDGMDIEGPEAEEKGHGFACRIYSQDGRSAGWPSVDAIRKALRRARTPNQGALTAGLRHLFKTELQYQPGMSPATSADGKEGRRLGRLLGRPNR